ncbi:hypothetical protein ABPG72_005154 [Tetrahymena utriculariae]
MNRSQLDKAREAQNTYYYIYKNQQKLSKIDKKLVLLLDKQHIPLVNSNSFDSSLMGKYNNTLLQNNNNEQVVSHHIINKCNPESSLDQSLILKKSVYQVEQKSKNQDFIDKIQLEKQDQPNSKHNSSVDKQSNAAAIIALEDINESCQSCVNNAPRQLSVIGASPDFLINKDDIPFHFRDLSNDISQRNQNE